MSTADRKAELFSFFDAAAAMTVEVQLTLFTRPGRGSDEVDALVSWAQLRGRSIEIQNIAGVTNYDCRLGSRTNSTHRIVVFDMARRVRVEPETEPVDLATEVV